LLGLSLVLGGADVVFGQTPAPAATSTGPPAAAPSAAAGGTATAAAGPTAAAQPAPNAAPPAGSAASTAPSTSGAPPAAGTGGPPTDAAAYVVRLRSLERNVNELKEQVFRTKLRLNVLKETVLGGVIGASRGVIRHKNEMSNSFRLIKAVYAMDGVQIFAKSDDTGKLSEMAEFDVYNGAIQPGSHTLTVQLVYQGNGFGVFSYLRGYKFNVRSSHTFIAGEGKATIVTAVGYEKGSIATNMEDKPAVEFRVNVLTPDNSPSSKK
jgi:hypothetical protein